MRRLGLIVHPTRKLTAALDRVRDWATAHDVELVQVEAGNGAPPVAPAGTVDADDLAVAIGGDGTVLAALRAAVPSATPVLGVACGSLGALSETTAEEVPRALDDVRAGRWFPRRLPALALRTDDGTAVAKALNDVVFVRGGTAQLSVDVSVDDERYVRAAGDGLIVATPFGASAYSMAAGGPLLLGDLPAFVVTPLSMHGGCAPPLVVPQTHALTVELHPGYGGFHLEVDGQRTPSPEGVRRFSLTMVRDHATLVSFTERNTGLAALRGRGLVADSPRVTARDRRAAEQH